MLLVERDLVLLITRDPRVLQRGVGIVAQGRRIAAEIEEEVFCQGCEALGKVEHERISLYLLQLLVVVIARLIAWVLPASEKLVGDDTACPEINFLRVTFANHLLRRHVKRSSGSVLCVFTPILLS